MGRLERLRSRLERLELIPVIDGPVGALERKREEVDVEGVEGVETSVGAIPDQAKATAEAAGAAIDAAASELGELPTTEAIVQEANAGTYHEQHRAQRVLDTYSKPSRQAVVRAALQEGIPVVRAKLKAAGLFGGEGS